MFDIRPIGYVIGIIVAFLGVMMIFPMILDFADGNPHWRVFAQAGAITTLSGLFVSMSCSNGKSQGLELQKTFLLTTGVWVVLPIFAALPFLMGATQSSVVDAVFEATSGLTTTGSTVISGLDDLPRGLLLWRGLLNWLGGIGIIVVAMVFLPELRVGGMQIFRAESFDTMGKILPRATQISGQISIIYIGLTIACFLSYIIADMSGFDALIHALTTVATGGFSSHDASFAAMSGPAEYVASLYMVLAALPFVRFVQLLNGSARPIFTDEQIRGFVATLAVIIAFSTVYLIYSQNFVIEQAFRQALFNIISIMSGTGYASADYMLWGAPMVAVFFFIGLIGGCAGSTACSVKIFRYQNYAFGHVNATAPHPIPKQRACSAFPRSSNFAGRDGLGHGVLCDVFYLTWGIGVFVGVDGLGFHYGAVGCGDSDRKYRPRPWARNWPNREF